MLPVRERHQGWAIHSTEFAISIVEFSLDGGLAKAEAARDVRVGQAFRHQERDLQLGFREKRSDLLALVGPLGFASQWLVHEAGRKTALTDRNRGKTPRNAIEWRLLWDNAPRSLPDRRRDFLLRGREEHHARLQSLVLNMLQEVDAAKPRKRDPDHRNSGPELPDALQGRDPITVRLDDFESRKLAKQCAKSVQIKGVIIGEQNAHLADLRTRLVAA